ncbi:MAG: efflux RND transporter periplasmic adaptor subunit [Desulfobacterales bacterium]
MTQKKRRIFHFVIAAGILVFGVLGFKLMKASKPALEKVDHDVPVPMARVVKVKTGTHQMILTGHGTVKPVREIRLVPQVSGKVIEVSGAMVNGGTFKKSDTLLQIDPADYHIAVTLAEARVKEAESRYTLAGEESEAARSEWENLNPDSRVPPLVAKEPQLAAAQATLDAEKANLKRASLDLERTKLTAPFDGRVSDESVDIGQYVTPGQVLAVLYSTDAAEILLPMEMEDLFWFYVPGFTQGEDGKEAEAEIQANVAGRELSWPGRVVRSEGKLDERTRLINVIVEVEKPYAYKPPLAVGLFVTVHIKGRTLEDAAVIPRSAVRSGGMVWVVDEAGRLSFRKVDIVRNSQEGAIVRKGLSDGEMVVTSPIKAVSDGMKVRGILPEKEETS